MRLLEFDVGPKRALRGGTMEPWQALSKEEIGRSEGSMVTGLTALTGVTRRCLRRWCRG